MFIVMYLFSWIYSTLPENKQILALSATYPEVLAQHLTAYMRNPTFVRMNATDPALLGMCCLQFDNNKLASIDFSIFFLNKNVKI